MALSQEELLRYARHTILPEVGRAGQEKLKAAKVLLVGAGGLGSPSALYLAAAGIGQLGIVDFDNVDLSNLHRQVIHGTSDLGRPKVNSAAETIRDINPHVLVEEHPVALSSANAIDMFKDYDLILDGTDNFPTRYLVNDACCLTGKINVYGSIFRFEGQATVFAAPGGPCYRCLFPEPPPPGTVPSCAEGGVLGILPGLVGLIQATETVKLILGVGESLIGRFLLFDAFGMRFQEVKIKRDPRCPICGDNRSLHNLIDYEDFCGMKSEPYVSEISVDDLHQSHASIYLIDVREQDEFDEDRIDGSILIPLGELPGRLDNIPRDADIVCHCGSGGRSAEACKFLTAQGYGRVRNLHGGIRAWRSKFPER